VTDTTLPAPLVPAEARVGSALSFATARVAPEKADFRPALPPRQSPGLNGTTMAKLSYAEQLKHPFWQRKRLKILERSGWACDSCGAKETTLHVHHKRYIKGALAWECDDADLATYCENCHADEHAAKDLLNEILSRSTEFNAVQSAAALLGGYFHTRYAIDSDLAERSRAVDWKAFEYGAFLGSTGYTTWRQMAEFVRHSYATFELGPLDPEPAVEAALKRWEAP
jgi:hypothetical protein